MAVKSAPGRTEFVKSLVDTSAVGNNEATFEVYLIQDIQVFLRHANSLLDILEDVFNENNVNGIAVM